MVEIGSPARGVQDRQWLEKAEHVHRQLRPNLPDDYPARIAAIVRDGAVMCVATRSEQVLGLVIYRIFENSHAGRRCYVDDLVTEQSARSAGIGKAMLEYVERAARAGACDSLDLESGLQRSAAHRFYFREGFTITGFSFKKDLK